MKKTVKKVMIYGSLMLSIVITSCQKEEVNTDEETLEIQTVQVEEFTRLVYNGNDYTSEEVYNSKDLMSLLEKPYFNVSDKTIGNDDVLRYTFDTEVESDSYFESGELENNSFARGINVRIAIELFDDVNCKRRIHRNVVWLNNFNFLYNFTLPGWAVDKASSSKVRVSGLPGGSQNRRLARVSFFANNYQNTLKYTRPFLHFENGQNLRINFIEDRINNIVNSYQINLEAW